MPTMRIAVSGSAAGAQKHEPRKGRRPVVRTHGLCTDDHDAYPEARKAQGRRETRRTGADDDHSAMKAVFHDSSDKGIEARILAFFAGFRQSGGEADTPILSQTVTHRFYVYGPRITRVLVGQRGLLPAACVCGGSGG
jgi:hypothetical protein